MSAKLFASIRIRLVVLVLLAILPATVLVLVEDLRQRRSDETHARAQADQVTDILSAQYIESRERVRQLLGTLAAMNLAQDSIRCDQAMAAVSQQFRQIMNVGVADLNGDIVCSGAVSPPTNVADRPYFQEALAKNSFSEGGFQLGRQSGKPSMGFGYPLRNDAGEVTGVILTTVDLTWLNQILASIRVPEKSTLTLFDRDGTILARYPDPQDWVGRQMASTELFRSVTASPGGQFVSKGLDEEARLYSYASLGGGSAPVYVTFGVPTEIAFSAAERNLRNSLAFLLLVAVLALTGAWLFGEVFLLRRIRSLAATARRLGRGDLQARSADSGLSEISALARTFDDMAAALELRELESHHYQTDLTRKVAQLNAIYGVFAKISANLTLEEVKEAALEQAFELVEADVVVLRLLKGELLEIAGLVSKDVEAKLDLRPLKVGEGLVGTVALTGKSVRVDRNVHDLMSEGQGVAGAQSGIAVPLIIHGRVLGTLGCWSNRPQAFPREIEQVLEVLASQIGVAIQMADARDTSERLARIDALTGLPNRLQLSEDVLMFEQDNAGPVVVAMIDIDHFKRLNDSFGHPVGDVVLKRIAAALKAALGAEGKIYRYGGEEFLVIAPCQDASRAFELAIRLKARVSELELDAGPRFDPAPIRVTVSIGTTLYPSEGATFEQAIAFADDALYQAKAAGRNQVRSTQDLHRAGKAA